MKLALKYIYMNNSSLNQINHCDRYLKKMKRQG